MNNIKILYNFKSKFNIKNYTIKNNNYKKKIILKDNVICFYNLIKVNFQKYNLEIIDISNINEEFLVEIFNKEIKEEDNLIIISDIFRGKFINNLISEKNKYINVIIDKELINRNNDLEEKILLIETLKFFIESLVKTSENFNGLVYLSLKNPIKDCGIGVYKILSELKTLYSQKEVVINIFSGRKLYLDDLSYITDPILEYTNAKAKFKIKNIVLKELEENFIVNILGVQ